MNITMPKNKLTAPRYQVEFKGNRYFLDGKMTKRVTSILKKFPDSSEGLIEWSKKRVAATAERLLRERVGTHSVNGARFCFFPEAEIAEIVQIAYKNPDDIKTQTADVGTAVHAFIDEWLLGGATEEGYKEICTKYLLPENPPLLEVLLKQTKTDTMDDVARNLFYDQMKGYMFNKFVTFWRGSGLRYAASEVLVGSLKWCYCGRLDILAADKKGRLILLDFKTSKWVSPSYFAQVAAYKLAYEEQTGQKIYRCAIVQCPREWTEYNQGFGIYPVKVARYEAIFLHILKFWNDTEFSAAKCRQEKI